jgi:MoaA/NifB/PqqE/SkfB family radical SAM enzyme
VSFFTPAQQLKLARSLITKTSPVYVQYYITGRCNLACEQCNIIYATADSKEMNIHQVRAVAKNLSEIGVCMVLLIGGEPFVRRDLPEIIEAFTENDIHVRMQTNGLADENVLRRCVAAGGHDISISLDTLRGALQDEINGGFRNSWRRAIRTIAMVNDIFPENGTGFFGTVLMQKNLEDVAGVLEFATAIGWGVSLVPVHLTSPDRPLDFRSFDDSAACRFPPSSYGRLREVLDELKQLRNVGMRLYDSDEYLDDIYRFVVGEPLRWRSRNGNVCDSPSLYFALDPNGDLKPCCDYKLPTSFPAYHPDFPLWYRNGTIHDAVHPFTHACDGCMYGSYPEITVSARFLKPMLSRFLFFNTKTKSLLKKMTEAEMIELAGDIARKHDVKRSALCVT